MKQMVCALFIFLFLVGSALAKDVWVKGHYRDTDGDGYKETYVNPYYRTAPDNNRYNNYSTEGNYNPYTGQRGYVDPNNSSRQQPYNDYSGSIYRRR